MAPGLPQPELRQQPVRHQQQVLAGRCHDPLDVCGAYTAACPLTFSQPVKIRVLNPTSCGR